tara:strand:- start:282 stop:674 length:393 start_codon:yes stop_codon:yes gene_type:complete
MPTVCELKIELKKRGIKGISGLNKSGLEQLLSTGKQQAKKEKAAAPKKEPKKVIPPLRLQHFVQEKDIDNLAKKSYIVLKKMFEKLERVVNSSSSTENERKQARVKLVDYEKAMVIAKKRQYGNRKKSGK